MAKLALADDGARAVPRQDLPEETDQFLRQARKAGVDSIAIDTS